MFKDKVKKIKNILRTNWRNKNVADNVKKIRKILLKTMKTICRRF